MSDSLDQRLALPVEQGVLLWCMRTWVLGIRHPIGGEARIQQLLTRFGAPAAAPYLEGFMFAIGHGATRAIGVHCTCCSRVSKDERALLDTIGFAQEARPFEALLLLRGMLAAESARAALQSAEGIGAALAQVGRRVAVPEMDVRQFAFAAGETLH